MKKIILPLSILFLTGCQLFDGIIGSGETGDPEEFWCNARGVCLLAHPDSFLVQAAIDQGMFIPHSKGPCEEPMETWTTLQRLTPINDGTPRLTAACCADMGCEGIGHNTESFPICMPDTQAWGLDGLIGAIAHEYDGSIPKCLSLPPLGFAVDYKYPMSCQKVACMEFDYECGCVCHDSSDCWPPEDSIEPFFPNGLGDWELACTGYPWRWDNFAYQNGAFVGTTCEWNQEAPRPGETPLPLVELMNLISCENNVCNISETIIKELLTAPSYLTSSSDISLEDGQVTVTDCNHICEKFNISVGDKIISSSTYQIDPLQSDAWKLAYDEFMIDGFTEIEILNKNERVSVLTLNKR